MSAGYRPYRIELRGTLVPSTAFHVGSGQNFHTSSDSPLLRETNDPAGRLYLPGSSLRGVLRGQLEREKELLGCTEGHIGSFFGMGGDENSTYGRFQVSNAYPTSSEAELRDHVRINNQWGAADSGAKFDLETGFAKEFRYEAVYEGDSANDPEMRLFHEALRHMQSDGFRVGAKSAWGLGRMRLQPDFEVLEFDRSTDEGLIAFLNWRLNEIKPASGLPKNTTVAPLPAPKAWSTITLTLELHFEGPVLVKSAIPASANPGHSDPNDPSTYWTRAVANADGTFVTTIDPLQNKYYLPGSSLRGVLRHEAMWISATKHDDEVNLLFGTANEKGGGSAGRFEIEDGHLIGEPRIVSLDHVAIDRILQAAADGKKFDAAALDSPAFSVRLVLRFEKENAHIVRWLRALLLQMERGRLWAGSGSARGYGLIKTVKLTSAEVDAVDELGWKLEGFNQVARNGRAVYTGANLSSIWAVAL